MAYVSKEMKAKIAPTIKAICKKYNVKASLAVRNHMTLVLNVKQGPIDFIGNYNKVVGNQPGGFRNGSPAEKSLSPNQFWFQEHFDGVAKDFLAEAFEALKGPDFFDDSDSQSDYFHCSHYIDVNVGQWDKPYALAA